MFAASSILLLLSDIPNKQPRDHKFFVFVECFTHTNTILVSICNTTESTRVSLVFAVFTGRSITSSNAPRIDSSRCLTVPRTTTGCNCALPLYLLIRYHSPDSSSRSSSVFSPASKTVSFPDRFLSNHHLAFWNLDRTLTVANKETLVAVL